MLKFNIYVNSPIDLQQLEWKSLIEYRSVFALERTFIGQSELKSVKPMLSFKTKVSGDIWLKLESYKALKTVKLKIEDGKIINNPSININNGVKDGLFARYVILDKAILFFKSFVLSLR